MLVNFNRCLGIGIIGVTLLAGRSVSADDRSLTREFTVRRWAAEDGLPETTVTAVQLGADGFLWCTTPRHVVRFDGVRFVEATPATAVQPVPVVVLPSEITLPETIAADKATAVLRDVDGALWVGTARGLYRYCDGQWQSLTARDGVFFPVDVRCLTLDQEHNLWAGTSGGLVRLRRAPLRVFRTGLPWGGEVITALLAESPTNFLTAVAGGGLVAGAPESLHLFHPEGLPEQVTISALLRRRDGTLLIGTQGRSLWRYRSGQPAALVDTGTTTSDISTLLEDRRDQCWVGTWSGLMTLTATGTLQLVQALPNDLVQILHEDRTGRLWVGYHNSGLYRLEGDGQFHQVTTEPVRSFYEDTAGDLWIGTPHGLRWWRGERRHRFTVANGLVDDVILQILEDNAGQIWLGTAHGMMRVKKDEFGKVADRQKAVVAARVFGVEAGMADEQCTGRFGVRATKTPDGRLWFPTMEGIVMADPAKLPPPLLSPQACLEELHLTGNTWSIHNGATLRLPAGARDLGFKFTAPVFTTPARLRFRHWLVGHEADWSWSTTERLVQYQRLPPGQYEFRVSARDRDGAWGQPASVTVFVPAFFWETLWFRLGLVSVAISLAALGGRVCAKRRSDRQRQEQERRHAIERERARIAHDIHSDIGAGLTEIALLSDLAKAAPGGDHHDRIFHRSHELVRSLDEIVWAINPRNDTFENLLSYLAEFSQDFLAAAGIACRLDLPRDQRVLTLRPNIRHHICLAVKEALHNAVRHTGATEVNLRVELLRQELRVTIADNGTGLTGEAVARSDGLANLQTQMHEIDGTAQLISTAGGGTCIVLTVQLPAE